MNHLDYFGGNIRPKPPLYWQPGAPSVVAGATAATMKKIAQVTNGLVRLTFVIVALQPSPTTVGPARLLPSVTQKSTVPGVGGVVQETVPLYLPEWSRQNASSAIIRRRRSDFIEATYSFAFVLATGVGATRGRALAADRLQSGEADVSSPLVKQPFASTWNICIIPIARVTLTVWPSITYIPATVTPPSG